MARRNNEEEKTNIFCSICIANYNGEKVIEDCLNSIISQESTYNFEIIIHDDASTDNSLEIIRSYLPHIQLIVSNKNVGYCISNNRMVEQARGKYILLLNNDAALFSDAIQTLGNQSKNSKDIGILSLPQYDWETGVLVDAGCLLDPFYNPIPNTNLDRNEVAMVIGACLWIERSLWNKIGGFPNWIESIAEDMYLCCKVRLLGYKIHVSNKSGYRHHQGFSFGGGGTQNLKINTTVKRRHLSERNKTYLLVIFTPKFILPVLLASHLTLLFFEGLIISLILKNKILWKDVYWNVFKSLLENKNFLFRKRKSIFLEKKISMLQYYKLFKFFPRKLKLLFNYGIPTIK